VTDMDNGTPENGQSEAEEEARALHAEAGVVDVHAHPALKAKWFGYDLSKRDSSPGLLKRIRVVAR